MRYPLSKCNKQIITSLSAELKRHSKNYCVPNILNIVPSTEYSYYMKGIPNKVGFITEINLKNPTLFKAQWGSWHGDCHGQIAGAVNNNKISRPLAEGTAVTKCYIDYYSHIVTGDLLLNPIDMPKPIADVTLSDRERNIMFIFGFLKDKAEKEMALCRLKVKEAEISDLIKKEALKQTNKGYAITLSGLAAKLDIPKNDLW